MSYIFISYCHEDKEYAHRLEESLRKNNFEVWIDDRIDYASEWPKVIQEKLDRCKVLIIIMTPRSFESGWVQNELSRALDKKKIIYPLLFEGDETWLMVQRLQYVDVRNGSMPPKGFYESLACYLPKKSRIHSTENMRKEIVNDIVEGLKDVIKSPKPAYGEASHHELYIGKADVNCYSLRRRIHSGITFWVSDSPLANDKKEKLLNMGWEIEDKELVMKFAPDLAKEINIMFYREWEPDQELEFSQTSLENIAEDLIAANEVFLDKISKIKIELKGDKDLIAAYKKRMDKLGEIPDLLKPSS